MQRDISKAGADGGAPRSEYLFKTSGELVRTGEYSFNTCGELVGICCVMKMMGSFSASIPDPKRQSDDRCVSAEKIIVQVVCQGVFVTVNNHFVGYSGIYKERSGQDGFQGLMVRNFVTGLLRNFFHKMINFQFIPRAGMSF